MTELEPKKRTTRDLELDDLLISNGENDELLKTGNNKKSMLLSAVVILLFVIIVLVIYLFQADSQEENTQNLGTQKPLERLEPQVAQTQNSNQQNTDFGQVPIQNNTNSDDQFQMIIEQIKAQQNQNNNVSSQTLPIAPSGISKTETSRPAPQPTQRAEPKQEPLKVSPKESFQNVKVGDPALQGSEAVMGFYIQVGSFSKSFPNKQLLELINENKFSYRMQKSGDNNRLLIGPYNTKQEAQNKLGEVREKINKDAFIKEIK